MPLKYFSYAFTVLELSWNYWTMAMCILCIPDYLLTMCKCWTPAASIISLIVKLYIRCKMIVGSVFMYIENFWFPFCNPKTSAYIKPCFMSLYTSDQQRHCCQLFASCCSFSRRQFYIFKQCLTTVSISKTMKNNELISI